MSKYECWGQSELIAELDKRDNAPYKKITVPMSERDCQDIIRGETFDWTFDEVDVHIELEDLDVVLNN